ncbi:hypothetical protein [Actinocorallia libanotica]
MKLHHHRTDVGAGMVRASCGTVVPAGSTRDADDLAVIKPVHRCKRCWSAVSSPGKATVLARVRALCEANRLTPLAGLILAELES